MNRRQIDIRDFEAVKADVQRLHENGYDKIEKWGLAQICGHLTIAMDQSLTGFSFKVPWLVRKLIIPVIKRNLYRTRKIKPGLKAPFDMVVSSDQDEAQAVEQLKQMVDRIDQFRGQFQIHPVFGPLSDDQWRQFHLIHISHHLSFLVPR